MQIRIGDNIPFKGQPLGPATPLKGTEKTNVLKVLPTTKDNGMTGKKLNFFA